MLRCLARFPKRPCTLTPHVPQLSPSLSSRCLAAGQLSPSLASRCLAAGQLSPLMASRCLSSDPAPQAFSAEDVAKTKVENIRNIGVSAHIDSGKTTVTERILYYCGRIDSIHDVKGKDGVGAKMDSMELERQRGITIKSAATSMFWKGNQINLIDTPGHIDFTVEVERALRVLDGAVLVLCAASGVQTQTYTVYRQMKRYDIPFISFINKMDLMKADADKTLSQMRKNLGVNAAYIYFPIGSYNKFEGIVDVLGERAVYFEGDSGESVVYRTVPSSLEGQLVGRRTELIECLSNVDEELGERFLMEEDIDNTDIEEAIKRTVLARTFTPVISGSALKNKGVQPLLDCVNRYLPNPSEATNHALTLGNEEKVLMDPARTTEKPGVGLAFKLEESKYGQLTYVRMYQGCLKRGNSMINTRTGETVRVPRLALMHSNEKENIMSAYAGDIVAMIGAHCTSGDTFVDSKTPQNDQVTMESMYVPNPVISMSIRNVRSKDDDNFSKALARFAREDPTFRTEFNPESKEIIIHGMGELHLDIYAERIRREYGCQVEVGKPTVNFRETLSEPVDFDVTYKRQSGGRGQFAAIKGSMELLEDKGAEVEFVNAVTGGQISNTFIKSVEKGLRETLLKGAVAGFKITGIRFILKGGRTHDVDSSDFAFAQAAYFAIKEHFVKKAIVMEPWMDVEVSGPSEASGSVIQSINTRNGNLKSLDVTENLCSVNALVALQEMFGYTTDLRKMTSGVGTFNMDFKEYRQVEDVEELVAAYKETKEYKNIQSSAAGS